MKSAVILCGAICFAFVWTSFSAEVQFDELVKNPARFDGQTVTVKGLLEVEGDYNSLWRDAEARRHWDWKHWIKVVPDLNQPPYPGTNMSPDSPAHLHWVRITGVVDTKFHGLFGKDPFGLLEKRVEVLPGPRLKEFLAILAWFKNDSGREAKMDVTFGRESAWFTIAPGKMGETGIERDNGTAVAKDRFDKPFAKCALTPPGSQRYYDRDKHAYYYRITKNTIEPVMPSEAKKYWRLYPYPDRD